MKKFPLFLLFNFLSGLLLMSCSQASRLDSSELPAETPQPLAVTAVTPESTTEPTVVPPTPVPTEPQTSWPDVLPFCRSNPDNAEGEVDCWVLKSVEEWLALEPRAGDEFAEAYWLMDVPLPPLPDGLEWDKERRLIKKQDGGYINFWVVVPSESQVPWPEAYFFCRPIPDDPDGKADCHRVANVEEWLQIDIQLGDNLGIWPESMLLPPLPEGLEWKKVRDESIGESFWIVFLKEEEVH